MLRDVSLETPPEERARQSNVNLTVQTVKAQHAAVPARRITQCFRHGCTMLRVAFWQE